MSESDNDAPTAAAEGAEDQANQVQLRIERLYLKDASFESPGSPSIFAEQQWRPKTQVDINTRANSLGDNRHEVVLTTTVTSTREEDKVAFVVEVQYAGLFIVEGASDAQLQQILGIACPNTLFPYVRENLDNLVTRGGFPALHITPVNFEALFAQAVQQARHQQSEEDVTTH